MMPATAIVWVAMLRVSSVPVDDCDDLATDLQTRLENTKMAMEPEATLAAIYRQATEASTRCETNEPLAYLRLRAAELGRGASVGHQSDLAKEDWRVLAKEMSARFPRSARVATVQARASGKTADARAAVNLDASYPPAQVALAAALLPQDPDQAAACLASVKDLSTVSDGYTILSRVRYAAHDVNGAIKAATLALHGRNINLVEPDARDPRPISGAHEILGLAYLDRSDFRKAAIHLRLAAEDSEAARRILENPPPGLRAVRARDSRGQAVAPRRASEERR